MREKRKADRARRAANPFDELQLIVDFENFLGIYLIIIIFYFAYQQTGQQTTKRQGSAPQLIGVSFFSISDVNRCTDNFSENNKIDVGGYGQVETLPRNGQTTRALYGLPLTSSTKESCQTDNLS